jgi:hypothetical protein
MVIIMNGTIRYTVRPYDTLWMLAQVFNTTVDSIIELNPGVDPNNLQVGRIITIRPGFQYYPPYPMDGYMMDRNMMDRNMMDRNMMDRNMMDRNMMDRNMMDRNMMDRNMMDRNMMNGNISDDLMDDMMGDEIGMLPDLMDYFRMLWGQHVVWTRMVMLGILYDLPELEFSTQRLLRTASDFANALLAFYGEEAAGTFENLFGNHITIAAELINAAKAGETNQVNTIWQRWIDNANQIAEFLESINPNWNSEDWSAMMMEHLELLGSHLTDMLEENFQSAIDNFDLIETQAMEMADMMAEGIAVQFP